MSELRRDPLSGRWVLLAPGRAKRPQGSDAQTTDRVVEHAADTCSFCPGHEDETPPEVARSVRADGSGWQVRVVPNLYPLVHGATGDDVPGADDLRHARPGGGVHEVAILSPDHDRSLAQLDDSEVVDVLLVLRDRARAHAAAGHTYTQLMVNHGAAAGASLSHPHAQIVAIDIAPPVVDEEVAHIGSGDGCVVCRELRRHDDDAALVVAGGDVSLWCPWWSSTAYESLLATRRHVPRFDDIGDELDAVATTLRRGLSRLDIEHRDPPYNLMFHSLPADRSEDFHWHIHIRPRLQQDAGFELGTGILVNTVDPAEAAQRLR